MTASELRRAAELLREALDITGWEDADGSIATLAAKLEALADAPDDADVKRCPRFGSVVLLSGPEDDTYTEPAMRFRLTYRGPLRASQRDPEGDQTSPLAAHKHAIRQEFHSQLKQLWMTNRFLNEHQLATDKPISSRPISDDQVYWSSVQPVAPMAEVIAAQYEEYGYRFVPLVQEDFSLLCSLSILFLRLDRLGGVVSAGDIDNRIKTLLDALRRPKNSKELVGNETPKPGEDPFFCLLEDDKLVTHLDVEADTLLEPVTQSQADQSKVHLIIAVDLRPYYATKLSLSYW